MHLCLIYLPQWGFTNILLQGKKDEDSYESSFDEKDKELLCSMFYDLTPPETKQAKGSNRR